MLSALLHLCWRSCLRYGIINHDDLYKLILHTAYSVDDEIKQIIIPIPFWQLCPTDGLFDPVTLTCKPANEVSCKDPGKFWNQQFFLVVHGFCRVKFSSRRAHIHYVGYLRANNLSCFLFQLNLIQPLLPKYLKYSSCLKTKQLFSYVANLNIH